MKKCTTCSVRFLPRLTESGKRKSLTFAAGLVCYFLVLVSVSAQEAQPETPQCESVRGTVVNSVTREPIGRALVFSSDNRFATLTDSEGHFEFTVPAPSAASAEARSEMFSIRSAGARRFR